MTFKQEVKDLVDFYKRHGKVLSVQLIFVAIVFLVFSGVIAIIIVANTAEAANNVEQEQIFKKDYLILDEGFEEGFSWKSSSTIELTNEDAPEGDYSVRGSDAPIAWFWKEFSLQQWSEEISRGNCRVTLSYNVDEGSAERHYSVVTYDSAQDYHIVWINSEGGWNFFEKTTYIPRDAKTVKVQLGMKRDDEPDQEFTDVNFDTIFIYLTCP